MIVFILELTNCFVYKMLHVCLRALGSTLLTLDQWLSFKKQLKDIKQWDADTFERKHFTCLCPRSHCLIIHQCLQCIMKSSLPFWFLQMIEMGTKVEAVLRETVLQVEHVGEDKLCA